MKKLLVIAIIAFGFQLNAMQINSNEDCSSQVIKTSSYKNGIVKKNKGEVITTKETMSLEISPCNQTVILKLNNKTYNLILYRTDEAGTLYAATLNGKQIIKIKINNEKNEVETLIGDLIFTTFLDTKIMSTEPIAVQE